MPGSREKSADVLTYFKDFSRREWQKPAKKMRVSMYVDKPWENGTPLLRRGVPIRGCISHGRPVCDSYADHAPLFPGLIMGGRPLPVA